MVGKNGPVFPMIGNFFSNGWKTFLATKNTKGTKFPTPFVLFVFFVAEPPPPPGRCGILPRHRARDGQGELEECAHGCPGFSSWGRRGLSLELFSGQCPVRILTSTASSEGFQSFHKSAL